MARVTLLLGGNEGDVKRTLQAAQQLVNARVGAVLRCSHRYESEPWGFASAARFSNQALEITTDLSPLEVLDAVQRIECDLGRNRAAEAVEKASTGAAYTSRPIDIDIIFYDDEVIREERLTVPHPRLAEREFALVPLCEIMRLRRHPVTGETVGGMLEALRKKERTMNPTRILAPLAAAALLAGVSRTPRATGPNTCSSRSRRPFRPIPTNRSMGWWPTPSMPIRPVTPSPPYEDALNGIASLKDDPSAQLQAVASSEPYAQEGTTGWVRMSLPMAERRMILAVDTEHRLYAYTEQELVETLPSLYVTLIFKTWKEGTSYKDGNWCFFNEFYTPPQRLDTYVRPLLQSAEDAAAPFEDPGNLKVYAYAVDTTAWRIASYDDAYAGRITSKRDENDTRTTPSFQAYADEETGLFSMQVSVESLMVVVVDRVNRLYAYSQQSVDLDGASPTFEVLFRPWRGVWIDVLDGWRIVNEALDPDREEQETQNTARR